MKKLVFAAVSVLHFSFLSAQPSKSEVINEFLPLMEIGNSIASTTLRLSPFFYNNPGITNKQLESILRQFIESGSQVFADSLTAIFDTLFTDDEIQQLQGLFNSPAGSKYRDLLPLITSKSIMTVYNWYLSNQDNLRKMIDSIIQVSGNLPLQEFNYTETDLKPGKPYTYKKKAVSRSVFHDPSGRYTIFYNGKTWDIIDQQVLNPSADIAFKMKDREVYAIVITEDNDLNLKELRYAAVYNLYKASGRYELIHDELRKVNGTELLSMQFKAMINSVEVNYHNYYSAHQNLVIQFSAFAGNESFNVVGKDMEDLLNGLVIHY